MNRSAWDAIVGVDLDDWMRADTAEQIAWLIWLRDHPLPAQGPPPCTCPPPSIAMPSVGSLFVPMVRGVNDFDPGCLAHGEPARRDLI